jgi:hypothetical protein
MMIMTIIIIIIIIIMIIIIITFSLGMDGSCPEFSRLKCKVIPACVITEHADVTEAI